MALTVLVLSRIGEGSPTVTFRGIFSANNTSMLHYSYQLQPSVRGWWREYIAAQVLYLCCRGGSLITDDLQECDESMAAIVPQTATSAIGKVPISGT